MKFRSVLKASLVIATTAALAPGLALAAGKTWKASIAQLPVLSDSKDKGYLIDMVKAIEKASGDKIEIEVAPFVRSLTNVAEHKADFHIPLLQNTGAPNSRDKFDYSSEPVYNVNFVLYTKKGSAITPATASKAKIETDAAHVEYFDFPTIPSSNLESSIKKVDAGRLDGLIFADVGVDPIIKANQLSNVQRTFYKNLVVKFVLPKGENGGEADKFLTNAIKKLKASGEWAKIVAPVNAAYDNWQP